MRILAILCAALLAGPALADACEEEIRGVYDEGGLFDPAQLSPQEHAVTMVAPDGTITPGNTSRWENAGRTISDNNGNFLMSYDGKFYQGQGWDGPWEDMGYPAQPDPVAVGREMNAGTQAALADTVCHGEVDLEGTPARKYTYRMRAETSGGASWWESDYTLFVDAETGARVRTEERNLSESWAPEVKTDTRVTVVTPLPGYTIPNAPKPE